MIILAWRGPQHTNQFSSYRILIKTSAAFVVAILQPDCPPVAQKVGQLKTFFNAVPFVI